MPGSVSPPPVTRRAGGEPALAARMMRELGDCLVGRIAASGDGAASGAQGRVPGGRRAQRERRTPRDRACEHHVMGRPAVRRAAVDAGRAERRASVITGAKITVSAAMRARDVSREEGIAANEVPPAPARPPAGTSAGGKSSGKKAARRRAAAARAAQRPSAAVGGEEPAGQAVSAGAASPDGPTGAVGPECPAGPPSAADPTSAPDPAGAADPPGPAGSADGAPGEQLADAAGSSDTGPGAGPASLAEASRSADATRAAGGPPVRSRHRSRARRRGK
jgi:hypothetical protein